MSDEIQLPRNLLLVDDEPNIVSALKRTLRRDNYSILTAGSGAEGLALMAAHDISVIISDQRMPQMTGVDFLRKVKALYPKTVRIVLSGYTEFDSVTSAINEGAIYKFLTKPWDDEQLRGHIQEAFLRYEMEQENRRLTEQIRLTNEELYRLNRSLEQQVTEKTCEIVKGVTILQVSQEILEHLPVAIIGIDEQQMIAVSNRRADELFRRHPGESLPGLPVIECLPESLLQVVQNKLLRGSPESGNGAPQLIDGGLMHVWVSVMGVSSRSRGTIVVLSPVQAY